MLRRLAGFPIIILAALLALFLTRVPSGNFIISPGGSYDVGSRLRVPDERRQESGKLAFTAVLARPGSWLDVLRARLDDTTEAVPVEEVRPRGISPEEFNQINRRLIDESKSVAAVVALRAAGFDARVTGQGAQIVATLEGMPAESVLREGDVVVAADGQPVGTAVELIESIRRHQVGEKVRLTVLRDSQRQELEVGTKNSPNEPGRPLIGASVNTRQFDVILPFPVTIDTENVGGASAGLMFSLGILDAVTAGILTRGYYVAGTGTIAADGSIGPIGGAAQKVMAAERDGAQIFLVPQRNLEDAQRGARSIRLYPVERFAEAVRILCGLEPLPDTPPEPPRPCASSQSG